MKLASRPNFHLYPASARSRCANNTVGPTSNDGLKGILRVGGGDRRVKHIALDQHSPPRVPVMPPQRSILNPWHSPDEDRYQR
jgi:hypothetical protein